MNNTGNNSTSSIKTNNTKCKNMHSTTNTSLFNQKISSIKKKASLQFSIGDKMQLYRKKIDSQQHMSNLGLPVDQNTKTSSQYIKYKYLKPSSGNKCEFMNNKHYKSINTNNYIINTLNLSEKNFINTSSQPHKLIQSANLESELNKYKKEKEELQKLHHKHERLIEKLAEDNKSLSDKINIIQQENSKLRKKISVYKENQEQLIMLVKIIQQNGVDVEKLIDKWNNEIENESESAKRISTDDNNISYSDSLNELNSKIDCSSFIPITVGEPQKTKKIFVGIPKLNFDMIKNNTITKKKKEQYQNKSK